MNSDVPPLGVEKTLRFVTIFTLGVCATEVKFYKQVFSPGRVGETAAYLRPPSVPDRSPFILTF
jgi:hypothetical protein